MKAPRALDDLVQAVATAGALPPERAAIVVEAVLRFLGSRLPSPLFGQLQERLQAVADALPGADPGAASWAAPGPGPSSDSDA